MVLLSPFLFPVYLFSEERSDALRSLSLDLPFFFFLLLPAVGWTKKKGIADHHLHCGPFTFGRLRATRAQRGRGGERVGDSMPAASSFRIENNLEKKKVPRCSAWTLAMSSGLARL